MTALTKYQRLESPGLWRETPDAQRREVVVGFREATLVLSDPRTETALSHWSLPAIERLNPGATPALYAPAPDTTETLEIDDPDMIAAMDTVRGVLARRRPRPGRLRGAVLAASVMAVAGFALFWLPGALVNHTASVLPDATRRAIGQAALADVIRVSGVPCTSPLGQRALTKLSERLFRGQPPQLLVLRDAPVQSAHLPGGAILLARPLIENADGPDAAAGFALAERLHASARDPMIPILHHAGITATFRLLTSGALPDGALTGYGEVLLRRPTAPLQDAQLLQAFATAEVSASPYAYALDPSGEATLALIEGDPFAAGSPNPLLDDADWVSLQAICSGA